MLVKIGLIAIVCAGLLLSGDAAADDCTVLLSRISDEVPATAAVTGETPDAGLPETGAVDEYVLKDPSFEELKEFILEDKTSRNEFVPYKYECRHFATDVNNNAEAAGFRCAVVLVCFERGQHAVVAFQTTDRGLVYIEPQTDAVIHPEPGGAYQGKEIIEILTAW